MQDRARFLTYFGGVPFVGCALLATFTPEIVASLDWKGWLLAYGAVILSFLGGIHWGMALRETGLVGHHRLAVLSASVVPSLIAWAALMLPDRDAGLIVTALGLALVWLMDMVYHRRGWLEDWFAETRTRISAIAVVSLLVGLAA